MPNVAERSELISKIKALPALVRGAVRGLNNEQLDTPYRQEGWTVRQVVHHLADSHLNAYIRMKLALTEDLPALKPYNQDEWAKLPDAANTPIQNSLSILEGLHDRWSLLLESLPESSWSRKAYHPEVGEMTVEDLLVTYAKHGENHVGQVTGLRVARGW